MDFLDFLQQRLNLDSIQASKKLEQALLNYKPRRKYVVRVLVAAEQKSE